MSAVDFGEYTPSEGEEIAVGDYVIYGFYERGTGRTLMDMGKWAQYENPLPGPSYETSPYTKCSVDEIKQFLDKAIFCDEELVSLMKDAAAKVGGAIFEDSLENEYVGIAWSSEIADTFQSKADYDVISNLMYILGDANSTEENEAQYQADYNAVLNDMYLNNHIVGVQSYVNEKTNYAYRAQAYHTRATRTKSVIDTSAASAILDLSEGESLAFGGNYDNYRYVTGGVHIGGKNQISSESFAIQDGSAYNLTWDRVVKIMNGMFAAGVNKVFFHGTSLDSSNANVGEFSHSNLWPGWSAFISICTDDWDRRMPYFEDVDIITDYIARNEAVLLNGTAKVDLLVYDLNGYDHRTRKENGDNSRFNVLLDTGYTYDNVMTSGLLLDELTAQDGVLCADGPAYKAVIVNDLTAATKEALEKLLSIAKDGVPVFFYKALPSQAAYAGGTSEEIQGLVDQIMATGNGIFAQSQVEIQNELVRREINPSASYLKSNLRVAEREDVDGSMYYYLYNNSNEAVDVEVKLKGNGNLYLMNAWNGEITKGNAVENEDGLITTMHFEPYGTTIAAVTANTEDFQAEESENEPVKVGNAVKLENWKLTIESWGPETDTEAPADTRKVNLEIGETGLGVWADMTVSEEQLAQTGVESPADISGIGYYSTEVDLSEVENVNGGSIILEHGSDMITAIVVNGQEVTDLNPVGNTYELGDALISGVNTIEIKLSTTLRNRVRIENGYFANTNPVNYGITSATLTPYIG